jgi:hypothetical protein
MADLKAVTEQIRKSNNKLNIIASDIKDEKGVLKSILGSLGNLVTVVSAGQNIASPSSITAPPTVSGAGSAGIIDKLDEVKDTITSKLDEVKKAVENSGSNRPGIISRFGQRIGNLISNPIQRIRSTIMAPVNSVRGAVMAPINSVRQSFTNARTAVQTVAGTIGAVGNVVGSTARGIGQAGGATVRGIRNLFSSARGGTSGGGAGGISQNIASLNTTSQESLEVQKEIRDDIRSIKDMISDFFEFQKQSRLDNLENKLEAKGDTAGSSGLLGAGAAAGASGAGSAGDSEEGGSGRFSRILEALGIGGGALAGGGIVRRLSNSRIGRAFSNSRVGRVLGRTRIGRAFNALTGITSAVRTPSTAAAAARTTAAASSVRPAPAASPRAPSAAAIPNSPTPSTPGSTAAPGAPRTRLGRLSSFARRVPYLGAAIGAVTLGSAINDRTNAETEEEREAANENIAGTTGFLAGAGAGAAIGSIVPGLGTFVGGVVGGAVGGIVGEEGMRAAYRWVSSFGEDDEIPERVEPRPEVTGSGRNRRASLLRQRRWDEQYGETHNHDGTLKNGDTADEVSPPPSSTIPEEEARPLTRAERRQARREASMQRMRDRAARGDGTFIAGERVVEGQALTENQVAAISAGISMGNSYSPEIMRQYNEQTGTNTTPSLQPPGARMSDVLSAVQGANAALTEEERRTAAAGAGNGPRASVINAPSNTVVNSTTVNPAGIPRTLDPLRPE